MGVSIIGVLLALGSILFLAYVTTRYVGGKSKKASQGNFIQVIETVSLGIDKQLLLVKVGEQFVLLSSSGKSIQFMTNITLNDYESNENLDSNNGVFDFKGLFDKYVQGYKEKKIKKDVGKDFGGNQFEPMEGENFKSNLNRLKNITGLINKKSKKDGDENTNEK